MAIRAGPENTSRVLLFPIYAILIWLFAAQWRRQWKGFAVVGVGTLVLLVIELSLLRLAGGERRGIVFIPGLAPGQVLFLLLVFTGLVAGVGLFIACSRPAPPSDMHCPRCFYDLHGLDPVNLHCPECGRLWTGKGSHSPEDLRWEEIEKAVEKREQEAILAAAAMRRRSAARAPASPRSAPTAATSLALR